jgi:hypothetical protein
MHLGSCLGSSSDKSISCHYPTHPSWSLFLPVCVDEIPWRINSTNKQTRTRSHCRYVSGQMGTAELNKKGVDWQEQNQDVRVDWNNRNKNRKRCNIIALHTLLPPCALHRTMPLLYSLHLHLHYTCLVALQIYFLHVFNLGLNEETLLT